MTALFVLIFAFVVGYAVNQGGTCAVAAAREPVDERKWRLIVGFAVATGAAGLVALPLAWATDNGTHLAGDLGVDAGLLAGALLLAIGALTNGACLLGSLWRLGNGELRMLVLPIGLAVGDLAAHALHIERVRMPSAYAAPGLPGISVVAAFGVVLAVTWLVSRRQRGHDDDRGWQLRHAMALLGACGAALYVLLPGWTYADAVNRGVLPLLEQMMRSGWTGLAAALLTIVGATVSAARLNVFRPVLAKPMWLMRTIFGGAVMAFGGSFIPGGNDTLLLGSVPAGTVSGAAAYTLMTVAIIAGTALQRVIRAERSTR